MSEIRAATVSNLAGTGPVTLTGQYAAKAWVNFNGTGTVAIRESGNVTSITDNGTGFYTVNFTTALQDANYSTSVATNNQINAYSSYLAGETTTTQGIVYRDTSGTSGDATFVSVAIHR